MADPAPLAPVAALLARRCPGLPAGDLEPLGEGDFYRAYALGGDRVVRVAKHEAAARALEREACLLPRLAPLLPLRVPLPVLGHRGGDGDPAFAVHPMLAGPTLTGERYLDLPEEARDRCAGAVGRFLAALHRTDLALPRGCDVPRVDYRARYADLLGRARAALLPRIAAGEGRWSERVLAEFLETAGAAPVPSVLLHGDLSPDHVLYDEAAAEVTGIIDFGDLAVGDPAWDLVYLVEDYGPDFLARALRAYPADGRDALLRRTRRFLELDAVEWAVRCAEEDDPAALAEAEAYLAGLRAQEAAPPWRDLLPPDGGSG